MKTDTPRPIRLKDYRPPSHLITRVDLDVALHPTETRVTSRLSITPNPAYGTADKLTLNGEDLELVSLKRDGKVVPEDAYLLSADTLTLLDVPNKPFKLEIVTQINPKANTALQGLYLSNGIYCTQCEAEGFRRITYMLDRPDVLAVYTCRIEADVDEAPVLLSNGNPRERGTLDGGKRHYAIWKDPHPKPSYLFALVGGNLTSIASDFTTASGDRVDLT
ncbi:MAG: aminopeptidase N, partial [Pseudomonadota bacterium]